MSRTLRRTLSAPVLAGALVLAGAPLVTSPAAAVEPTVPGLHCAVNAVQTASNSVPVAITDVIPMPSASIITVPAGGALSWLRVRTDITHTNPGDLLVTLTSPAGSILTLTSGNGGTADNVFNGTWWEDDAGATSPPGSAAEATYVNNVLQQRLAPEEGLGALRGESVAGNWTLTVFDQVPNASPGTLNGWALEYATRSGAAPDAASTGTGALAGSDIPVGQTRTFTHNVQDSLGALQDVATVLDISGASGSTWATLTSPSGTEVTLTKANGAMFNGFLGGTTFADSAGLITGPVADLFAFPVAPVKLAAPQEPLSALTGESAAGLWTLKVANIGGLPLTLNDWSLDLTNASCGLDSSLTQLSTVPTQLPVGSTFAYAVAATNNRLATLTGNQLGLTLPAGLELVSVTSTLGSCTGLTCALGTLLPGAQAVVVYVLKVVSEGTKTINLDLTHIGLDALPINNVLSFVTTVTPSTTPPGTTPAKDTTAPSLVMMLGKDKLKTVAKKGVLAAAGWTEAGKLILKVKLPGKVAKRLKLPTLIGKRTVTTTKAGTAKLRIKVSKKAAKKLLKATKPVRIVVKGQLKDAAGNVGKASAGSTFKP